MKAHYLNNQNVKKRIKENNKQASKEFIREIDVIVETIIDSACKQFNGRHKRLSVSLIPKKYR